MSSLLELREISKKYENQTVLQSVSLHVNAGEVFGLLGESGSGKSTLLRIAAGLIDADEGEVWLDRQTLRSASDQLIPGHPDIKIVHQDYHLSAPLSVRENIAYALRYYEKAYREERVEELMELCRLEAVAHRPAKQLSGGEKQRTAIARALAEEARVLLLDEPFAHLDLPNRRRLTDTIRDLAEQTGIGCIFVTHEAPDVLRLSHRMGVMKAGELLQIGTPETVYRQPLNRYIAELTGEINLTDADFFLHPFIPDSVRQLQPAMLRPEAFILQPYEFTNASEAVVKQIFFEGSRYLIYLQIAQHQLKVYHQERVEVGQSVFVGLRR
ncbi:MAG: ABC transporter ATP-binding protein [Spirosomataceae bacterium]